MIVKKATNESWLGTYKFEGYRITPENSDELRFIQSMHPTEIVQVCGVATSSKTSSKFKSMMDKAERGKLRVVYRGGGHSYNINSIGDVVVDFNHPHWKEIEYNDQTKNILVGAGNTIEEIEHELLNNHRRLINRGNYNQQTFIGAALQGTHGYGSDSPSLMSHIISTSTIGNAVIAARIKTAPLQKWKVRLSTSRMGSSELTEQSIKLSLIHI